MATAYVDIATIHVPSTGGVAPATWGLQIRENLEALIDPPACDAFNSTTTSVSSGVDTILNANSERFDNDALHSTVTNTSRITIQKDGRYSFRTAVAFAGNATGLRKISFRLDGTTESIRMQQGPGTSADFYAAAIADYVLTAGQYVEVLVAQLSGGALNTTLHSFAATLITR